MFFGYGLVLVSGKFDPPINELVALLFSAIVIRIKDVRTTLAIEKLYVDRKMDIKRGY